MAFRAMATRAQRADCHDSCDGEAELEIGVMLPLLGTGEEELRVELMDSIPVITEEISNCCEVYPRARLARRNYTFSSARHIT
jgi:hypothetical protein